jgi:Ca-activated chloride channel homolog
VNWHHFGFAHPWLLWLLALLPLLAVLQSARGAAAAVRYSSLEPFRAIGVARKSRAGGFLLGLLLAALAACILALARPQLSDTISRSNASGIDIMLALDVSGSMLAEDVSIGHDRANRIEAVKKLSEDFIEGRPNDRIGMVAFGTYPYLVSPLTLDHEWLFKNLERVRIGLVEGNTAIGSALASAANRLRENKEAKSKIIVLLTDGGNNCGKVTPNTAAEAAHSLGIKIYTIGIGTNGQARIPQTDQNGNPLHDFLGRPRYAMINCDVDVPGLQKIAEIGGGKFFRGTDAKAIEDIFHQIDQLEKSTVEISERKQVRELYPWFLGTGAALLVLNLLLELTVWRRIP